MERSNKGANPAESYKPKTNKKSLEMANAKLKESGQGLSHAEYLIQKGKEYEQKRMEKLAEKEAKKMLDSECTFSPQILISPQEKYEEGASPEVKKK